MGTAKKAIQKKTVVKKTKPDDTLKNLTTEKKLIAELEKRGYIVEKQITIKTIQECLTNYNNKYSTNHKLSPQEQKLILKLVSKQTEDLNSCHERLNDIIKLKFFEQ